MTPLRNITRIIAVSAFIALLAGCASIPPVSNETGMLLIPIHYQKEVPGKPFIKYRVVFSDGTVTYLHADKSYGLVKNLAPGHYKVDYMEAMYIQSGRLTEDYTTNLSFTIEPGKITTSDNWLRVRLYKKPNAYYQQGYFERMTQTEKQSKMKEFSANNDLSGWVLQ
ncbi:hypothetical protein QWZ13_19125 [Reinekea marina]|uniref:DUF2846 domain-containing protein n=1 Tax=Reinekea marina TaxID=1310421 RepID=A0ABV7WTM7_9GAMM|nr:hypothetical protein [Reinekea marina]MDN3651027.1 hypothetical protein [Reinekea marina]